MTVLENRLARDGARAAAGVNSGRFGGVLREGVEHPRTQIAGAMADAFLTHETGVREAYAAHAGELYGFALRSLGDPELAEEAVQDTFLRAWRAGDRFDPELGSLRTWLFAILRNVVIDLGRARAARPRVGGRAARAGPRAVRGRCCSTGRSRKRCAGSASSIAASWSRPTFAGAPTPRSRSELGVPEGTIKSRVYYGLKALRNALEEMGYEG